MKAKEFSTVQARLDRISLITSIKKIDKKAFQVLLNYEVKKVYKTRISSKRYIVRLYNKEFSEKLKA